MTHDPDRLADFAQLTGRRADIASYYCGFGDVFPGPVERQFADGGRRRVLLSWDPGATRFSQWANGRHDAYLDEIVAAAVAYPYDVYVRPWPEMNGDWATFQPTPAGDKPYGGTYHEFKAAWRHVVTYVRDGGATNIKWVFNPAVDTYAETTPVRAIWPGARYVDVLGIDGFNWGDDDGWGRWRSYEDIFTPMYDILTGLHPTAPVWICEFGSKEPRVDDGAPASARHSKGRWLTNAYGYDGFPRVRAQIYFHMRKERDWRLNSSREARLAVRRALD